jgi:hypothetical protein
MSAQTHDDEFEYDYDTLRPAIAKMLEVAPKGERKYLLAQLLCDELGVNFDPVLDMMATPSTSEADKAVMAVLAVIGGLREETEEDVDAA